MIYQIGLLAGWPYAISENLRKRGFEAINIVLSSEDSGGISDKQGKKVLSKRALKYDKALNDNKDSIIAKLFNRIKLIFEIIKNGQMVHYHSGTILPFCLDTYIFKFFKIPMFISWGGGDARIIEMAVSDNPFFYRFDDKYKDRKIRSKLKTLAKNGVKVITDPEMEVYCAPFFKNIYRFRPPIDIKMLDKYVKIEQKDQSNIVKILHMPTHPIPRGTVFVEDAISRLQKDGYKFEYKFITNLTQHEVYQEIANCDILVDELRTGSHGVLALESCALYKPTITYIKESIIDKFPKELPFVNTNPITIYDNLKFLILNPQAREELGKKSRMYVEKYHEIDLVVDDLIKIYKECGAKI